MSSSANHFSTRYTVLCSIQPTGDRIIKCLLGKVASLVGGVEDLIVKDREVESQAKANRMCRGEIRCCNLSSSLVCLQRLVGRSFALITKSKLGKIAVVVTLPAPLISY